MSSREVYEIAITRPTGVSVADMQRYINTAVQQWCKGGSPDDVMRDINEDSIRVMRQAPVCSKFWVDPAVQLPQFGKVVHIRYTNGLTTKAMLDYYKGDPVKVCYWINMKTGRKIPWDSVQAWMI